MAHRVVNDAYSAAEVDILDGTVQNIAEAEGQREAVFVVADEGVRREILGAQVDMEAADGYRQRLQQSFQCREVGLVDAELGRSARTAVHTESGVHAQADGLCLAAGSGHSGDSPHLADRIGDQMAVIPRGGQCTIAFAGGGEVDILLRDPAFRGQADLTRTGRIRADAKRRKVPYYRWEGVGLHGEQNIKAGEGPVESLCLCGKDLAGVNVAGRVLTRQGEGIFVHGAPSFRVLLMTV